MWQCIDDIDEAGHDGLEGSTSRLEDGVQKSKRQMSVKRPVSPLYESFVERNKATNNNVLQKLHSFGKLFEASILVEFMARHSQIPPFHSYTNLITGLVNKDHVEEGKLQRPSKLR